MIKVKRKIVIYMSFILIFCGMFSFFLYENRSTFNGNRVKNPDCYTLEFSEMNQEDSHTLDLHEGDTLSIDYSIDRGNVDLSVGILEEDTIYKGNDIDSAVFDLVIPKDGNYKITVSSKHASGFINIYAHEKK